MSGSKISRVLVLPLALASVAPLTAAFAQDDVMVPITVPAQPDALPLPSGALPGATVKESWHRQYGKVFARNVTEATLTPFLPDPAKATGSAVIVAPGGGFRTLSMENEGWDVARALASRGVAAFVLKYRLNQTPAEMGAFAESMRQMFAGPMTPKRPLPEEQIKAIAPQIADARAAFALVRQHAKEWRIDPGRIGMVGFSAGAMLTMATAIAGKDARPAFLGDIYGPLLAMTVPQDAPPLFVALAADDPLFGSGDFGLIDAWRKSGHPVEFHLYEQGGHGFGMYPKSTTSTGWFEAFVSWLTMHGYLAPAVPQT